MKKEENFKNCEKNLHGKEEKDGNIRKNSNSNDVEKVKCEVGEDATKYGEFVSSYFAWIPLPDQKERAIELDKMTKNREK